jgi:hypothetical protein
VKFPEAPGASTISPFEMIPYVPDGILSSGSVLEPNTRLPSRGPMVSDRSSFPLASNPSSNSSFPLAGEPTSNSDGEDGDTTMTVGQYGLDPLSEELDPRDILGA